MRILFLNAGSELGGAERSLLDLMASLRNVYPVELHLAVSAPGPLCTRAERIGVRTTVLPMPAALAGLGDSGLRGRGRVRALLALATAAPAAAWGTRRYVAALQWLVADVQPDIIHTNSIKFHLLGGLARLRGPTVVWHVRDFLGDRPLVARALRWGARVSGIAAISEAVGDDVRSVLPRAPVEVVYNAVDTDHFCPGPGDGRGLDALAGLPAAPPGTVRVGLVASFARWKGQEVFLAAAARLARDHPAARVRCYVVGGPIYQTNSSQWSHAELRPLAPPETGFIDFQDDPRAIYRALDIVVHASTRREPFGRTIVEAMACGRATVVSRAGGAAELFTEDEDAIGVLPGDVGGLADAIGALACDRERRLRLGRAARRKAVASFDRARLGPQVLDAYRRFGVPVANLECNVPRVPLTASGV
jgi:glycosyltransferase involved in cell wall biosynthesis